MKAILLSSSLIALATAIATLIFLIKEMKAESFNKKEVPLITISLSSLILSFILFLWATDFFVFSSTDFLIVTAVILIIQTSSILFLVYELNKDKKIKYISMPFILLIALTLIIPHSLHLAIPISLFTVLLAFLLTMNIHEKSTRLLIFYSSVSVIFYVLTTIWQNMATTLSIILSLFFLAFLVSFLKFLQTAPKKRSFYNKAPSSPIIGLLKHLVFIVIITNFIFIGTVSIHEFGHLSTSSYSNCESTKIVYELKGLPHTEIKCEDTSKKSLWILSGVLLPFIVAAFLFFGGGKFMKEIALQIIGFNLIISYLDLVALNISEVIATFILIIGVTLSVFSLALLIRSRVE